MTTQTRYPVARWYAVSSIALLVVVVVGLGVGEVPISPTEAWLAFVGRFGLGEGSAFDAVFWSIRMPRIVAGVLVGATLGAAGAALQGVYRNPMADPFLLGISSAAGLGVVVGIALAMSSIWAWGLVFMANDVLSYRRWGKKGAPEAERAAVALIFTTGDSMESIAKQIDKDARLTDAEKSELMKTVIASVRHR